jgi:hypothetical protein
MAVYKPTATRDTYPYATDYKDEEGNPKPETIRVTPARLNVGDIVLILVYEGNVGYTYRSSAVSAIERHPTQSYGKKWKVTTVDSKGKVDVFELGDGKIYQFERQCSQETKENAEERSLNITLRRDIARLEGKVLALIEQMDRFRLNGGKNPKLPGYREQVVAFHQALGVMYDDVGNDLGLPPRSGAQRKKKKRV